MRSRECPRDGLSPISSRKLSKESHLSQTLMPFPPYARNPDAFGFVHLWIIRCHKKYNAVLLFPCFVNVFRTFAALVSRNKQPQLRVLPDRKLVNSVAITLPQAHLHSHSDCPDLQPMRRTATRRP